MSKTKTKHNFGTKNAPKSAACWHLAFRSDVLSFCQGAAGLKLAANHRSLDLLKTGLASVIVYC